jgi:hypothetical protein
LALTLLGTDLDSVASVRRKEMFMAKFRFVLMIGMVVFLSGCGSSSSQSEEAAPVTKLSPSEISTLKSGISKLNVNKDDFTNSITYSSTPEDKCSGHNFWLVVKADLEYGDASAYLYTSTVDDINDNIGNPSKMTSLTKGEKFFFASSTGGYLDNVSCAGYSWAYPSKFSMDRTDVNSLIASLEDNSSLYRLSADTYKSGYRDITLSSSQTSANLAVLRLVKGFWERGLTPKDLM